MPLYQEAESDVPPYVYPHGEDGHEFRHTTRAVEKDVPEKADDQFALEEDKGDPLPDDKCWLYCHLCREYIGRNKEEVRKLEERPRETKSGHRISPATLAIRLDAAIKRDRIADYLLRSPDWTEPAEEICARLGLKDVREVYRVKKDLLGLGEDDEIPTESPAADVPDAALYAEAQADPDTAEAEVARSSWGAEMTEWLDTDGDTMPADLRESVEQALSHDAEMTAWLAGLAARPPATERDDPDDEEAA